MISINYEKLKKLAETDYQIKTIEILGSNSYDIYFKNIEDRDEFVSCLKNYKNIISERPSGIYTSIYNRINSYFINEIDFPKNLDSINSNIYIYYTNINLKYQENLVEFKINIIGKYEYFNNINLDFCPNIKSLNIIDNYLKDNILDNNKLFKLMNPPIRFLNFDKLPKFITKITLCINQQLDLTNLPIQLEELNIQTIYPIDLTNLPYELKELIICTQLPIDLSNLPNLTKLDIQFCTEGNFNLDSLPETIKFLYLPQNYVLEKNDLPIELKQTFVQNGSYKQIINKWKTGQGISWK